MFTACTVRQVDKTITFCIITLHFLEFRIITHNTKKTALPKAARHISAPGPHTSLAIN